MSDRVENLIFRLMTRTTSVAERLYAIEQLRRMGPAATNALDVLRTIANSGNRLLQARAIQAIAEITTPADARPRHTPSSTERVDRRTSGEYHKQDARER